jgi:hypothetical protein
LLPKVARFAMVHFTLPTINVSPEAAYLPPQVNNTRSDIRYVAAVGVAANVYYQHH